MLNLMREIEIRNGRLCLGPLTFAGSGILPPDKELDGDDAEVEVSLHVDVNIVWI